MELEDFSQKDSTPLKNPHQSEVEDLVKHLSTNLKSGLTKEEASARLSKLGRNVFKEEEGIKFHKILFHHVINFMSFVLLAAAILSVVAHDYVDAGVIIGIIVVNAAIGFIQEYKSEKTIRNLMQMSQPTATVVRDGHEQEIPSDEIVLGDIVLLKQGDKVPADLRLYKSVNLECDEALLTGESLPIKKITKTLDPSRDFSVGDKKNLSYMSTTVSKGKGKGIVIGTGTATEIGKIASTLARAKKQKTKLQQRTEKLGLVLVVCAILAIGIVLLAGWAWDTFEIYPEGLSVGISAAVSIIPEALVPVVTLTLTLGVRKMATQRAIIRNIAAVESLGNITNICTDKTGTLTLGKMTATDLWVASDHRYIITGGGLDPKGELQIKDGDLVTEIPRNTKLAVMAGALCNTSSVVVKEVNDTSEYVGVGSPTEVALVVLGQKLGLDRKSLEDEWQSAREFPFDSSIKRMGMVYKNAKDENDITLFVKGAPERIVKLCRSIVSSDGERNLDENDIDVIQKVNDEMASEGLRVLSLSYKKIDSVPEEEADRSAFENDLVFIGLVGIKDPPREVVPQSIQVCHDAGIVVHMVTGDHPSTATAIAKQIGILPKNLTLEQERELVTTATEFDALTENELRSLKDLPLVIARCSPESKVRVVQALHDRGRFCAMLGDGVNDSPAIKIADVGVSMGMNGSDVTKEASDLVLTDDDFSTVVVAIKEGRRIFANIRKFLVHLLTTNVAESLVIVIAVIVSLPVPMTPLQVLWVNIVTGTPPALALGIEPASKSLMDKNKRKPDEALFTVETIVDIVFYGVVMCALSLLNFIIAYYVFDSSLKESRSVTFATLTITLMLHSYNCRNLKKSFLSEGFFKRYWLHAAVLFGISTMFLAIYVPALQTSVFKHRPPDWRNWFISFGSSFFFVGIAEVYKVVKRRIRRRLKSKNKQERTTIESVVLP